MKSLENQSWISIILGTEPRRGAEQNNVQHSFEYMNITSNLEKGRRDVAVPLSPCSHLFSKDRKRLSLRCVLAEELAAESSRSGGRRQSGRYIHYYNVDDSILTISATFSTPRSNTDSCSVSQPLESFLRKGQIRGALAPKTTSASP